MVSRSLALAAATTSLIGCAGASIAQGPPPATAPLPAARSEAAAAPAAQDGGAPDWRVTLRPIARSERLAVTIETSHLQALRWVLPSQLSSGSVEVRDGQGRVAAVGGAGPDHLLELAPARPLRAPLSLRYELSAAPASPCPFQLTPDRAVFCGAAVLAIPEEAETTGSVELRLLADGDYYRSAASSFGLGAFASFEASFQQLARAGYLFGDVHHARFAAPEGRDHAAWLDYFSFDPRWVAAEAAGVRTAVDRWLGIRRPADDPTVGLLFVGIRDTRSAVRISPVHRGALIQAGPSAAWSLRERLDLTRLLVQRTLGGSVTVSHPGARWWFDEGLAHAVALHVLVELGAVSLEEAAAEASSWLAEEALSVHAGRSLGDLVQAAAGDDRESAAARRLIAIRGALLGLALGGSSGEGLKRAARQLIELASAQPSASTPAEAIFASADDPRARSLQALRAAFEGGGPIPLPTVSLSPCLLMVPRRVHRFELGFTTRPGRGGAESVVMVDPSGPAARAGVREGDTILSFDHVPDRSDLPADLDLKREDDTVHVRYLPRGPSRQARALTVASRSGVCASGG